MDFPRKPYADLDEVQGEAVEAAFEQPVNFYDNEDGFWDDYIEHKRLRWEENPMLVHRQFFKH